MAQQQTVARSGALRGPQPLQLAGLNVGAAQVERVARRGRVAYGQRHGHAPCRWQELIEVHGAHEGEGVVGQVARVCAELAELAILARQRQREVGDVGGRERHVHCGGGPAVLDDVAQADVVDPELGLGYDGVRVDAPDPGRHLLHRSEVGRCRRGIAHVDEVGPVAHHVGGVERSERRVGTARSHARRHAAQPRLLHLGPQGEPAGEVGDGLGLPRVRSGRHMIEVEVVLVLADLDVELEVTFVPAHPPPACPDAEAAILEEVLVARGREAQVRLGVLPARQPAREQAQRALVDLGRPHLEVGVDAGRLVDDPGRRRVAQVGVLGAHHGRDHLARPRPPLAREPGNGGLRALDPRRPDEPHARQAEEHLRIGPSGERGVGRDDRDSQALHLPQRGTAFEQRVGAERDAVQAPPRRPVRIAERVLDRHHTAVAHVVTVVADREHVTHEALGGPDAGRRVELEVAVQVLGVDGAVVAPAARPQVPEAVPRQPAVHRGAAERQRVAPHACGRVPDPVRHAVAQNPLVIDGGAPGVRERLRFGVEPPDAGTAVAGVGGVPRRRYGHGLGHERERVLEHRAEVE